MSKIILEQKVINGFPLQRVEFEYDEGANIYDTIDCVIKPLLIAAGFSASLVDEALGLDDESGEDCKYDTDEI